MSKLLRGCVLVGLVAAATANATQTVQPVKDAAGTAFGVGANATSWTHSAGLGTVVTVIGRYTTDNVNGVASGNESGLGLKVKYDETKFTGVTVTALSKKCMIAPPQIQLVAAGSSQAVLGWIDTAIRTIPSAGAVGWPLLADPATSASTSPCLNPNGDNDITATTGPAVNLFQFQGTLAPSVGVGNSADIIVTADGNYSYAAVSPALPGMADQKITVTAAPAPTIALSSVVSRKTHTGVGVFDLPLPNYTAAIGGTIDVEPRSSVAQPHVIVFQFNAAVTSVGTATIAGGTTLQVISGASATTSFSGTEVTVTLTGIPDKRRVQISVPGVNGSLSVAANLGFLLGDVTGNGGVTSGDITAVRAASGFTTSASNYKSDLNTSGGITSGDITIVRSQSGLSLDP